MTPESAEYHRLMLMVGLRDRFDQEFDQALEQENPLSDLILNLTSCVSDLDKASSILHSYAVDNNFDEQKVFDLVTADIRNRYFSGQLSRMETAEIIHTLNAYLEKDCCEPWWMLFDITYALEDYRNDSISESAFISLFDMWFFRGEPTLNLPPQVISKIEKPHHSKAYWKNLVATLVTMFLGFTLIGLTIALTGARDIQDFTKQDQVIFSCFLISLLPTWGLSFFFANRCGKGLHERSEAELAMLAAHKNDGLSTLPYPCDQVLFETNGIRRAIIQSWHDHYYVSIERFFFKSQLWHPITFQSDLESLTDVADFLRSEGISPEKTLNDQNIDRRNYT